MKLVEKSKNVVLKVSTKQPKVTQADTFTSREARDFSCKEGGYSMKLQTKRSAIQYNFYAFLL